MAFLTDRSAVSPRHQYLPVELEAYMRRVQSLVSSESGDVDYDALLAHFSHTDRSWEELVERRFCNRSFPAAPVVMVAAQGRLIWRPWECAVELNSESVLLARKDIHIYTTGQMQEDDLGIWLEADPVWSPELPKFLSKRCWLLQMERSSREKLLQFVV